jgi:predicted NUDIX family NTP pyrophosphohydrolase
MGTKRRTSAGLLPFRRTEEGIEVFLVHPGGPYWKNKDDGAWSIAKGELSDGEDPLDAAKRELAEETGVEANGTFIPLSDVKQPGGKTVQAWAVEMDFQSSQIRSNTFEMEWPPRSGRRQTFPEVDRAEWFPMRVAERKILTGQSPLLTQLQRLLLEATDSHSGSTG